MKRHYYWTFFCCLLVSTPAVAQTIGALDLSLQGTGYRIETAPSHDYVAECKVASDGKILVVGTDIEAQPAGMVLRRYLDNGDPDPNFGNNGYVLANTVPLEGAVVGVGMQSDGKIVFAGGQQGQWHPVVERLLPNGDLDTSFGQSGIVHIPVSQGAQYGLRLFVLDDDRIVLGYFQGSGFGRELGSCRLLPNGDLDTTYGLNGLASLEVMGGVHRHNAMAIDSEDRLLFAGVGGGNFPTGNFLARMDSTGAPDSSYGVNGSVVIPSGTFDLDLSDITYHPDGSSFVMGTAPNQPLYGAIAIGKYLSNGDLDSTFGVGGIKFISSMQMSLVGSKILVDDQDYVVFTGRAASSNLEFMMGRLHPDGTLDTGVSAVGWRTYTLSQGGNLSKAAALDNLGRLVMAGNTAPVQDMFATIVRVTLGIPLWVEGEDLVLWPNVGSNNGQVNLSFAADHPGMLSYRIMDLQGREVGGIASPVLLATGTHTLQVPINNMASGLYLVQVMFDGKSMVRRLLVN